MVYIERFPRFDPRVERTRVLYTLVHRDACFLRDEEKIEIFLYSFEIFDKSI